jgi:hypothetical protein
MSEAGAIWKNMSVADKKVRLLYKNKYQKQNNCIGTEIGKSFRTLAE